MRNFLILLGFTLPFWLNGCASNPTKILPADIAALDQWQLEGKLAVRAAKQSQSASFSWHNHGDDYTIRLHGPLGQGNAQLTRHNSIIRLKADGTEQSASSAEELLTMNLGWSFPVSDMVWWIRGLASPNAIIESQRFNDSGQLAQLQQQGWHIHYKRYQQWQHLTVPYKLVATRDNVTLTLLLKKWEL